MKKIKGLLKKSDLGKLKCGEEISYTGFLYTARDQAHKRIFEGLGKGKLPPVNLKDAAIYYCGPTPSRHRGKLGSAGPTTSSRMDKFTPAILNKGVSALIGKGSRSKEVIAAIKKNKCVYFLAIAGAGAYLSKRIKKASIVAYKDLGAEAVHKLYVEDFPLIVGIDSKGNCIYK